MNTSQFARPASKGMTFHLSLITFKFKVLKCLNSDLGAPRKATAQFSRSTLQNEVIIHLKTVALSIRITEVKWGVSIIRT